MLKVLMLIDTLACGGKERQFAELTRAIVEQRLVSPTEVGVVCMDECRHFDGVIESAGVRIIRLLRRWRWDPGFVVRLGRLLRTLKPQVICSFNEMATFYAALARKPARTRLIDASLRNALPLRSLKERGLGWLNYRAASLIVANSNAGLVAKGVPSAKARVLHNGFDSRRVSHPRAMETTAFPAQGRGPRKVGMVATFSRYKDWDTFFEAARQICLQRSDVTFFAVGGGEFLPDYRRRFGGMPGMEFTGHVSDVEGLLGDFDLGVLCSSPRFSQEGIPNVVMEYMAMGLPVVVTRGGGVAELVLDGKTGFIIEPAQPEALAAKICWLLEHTDAARAIGELGRERIKQNFSMERAATRLMELIKEASGGPQGGKD